jgi:hypothetical protein
LELPRKAIRSPLIRPRRAWARRLGRAWWSHQWSILAVLFIVSLLLGYVGFAKYYEIYATEKPHAVGDLVYYAMQLIPMVSGGLPNTVPWELEVARHVLPLIAGYALVVAVIVAFWGGAERLRVRLMRGHVVICGLGDKGVRLSRSFKDRGVQVVVIENDGNNPRLEQCREEGMAVVVGDAATRDSLKAAGVDRAGYLISTCDDDSTNARVAIAARDFNARRRGTPLTCIIHIVDPQLYSLLRERELTVWPAGGMRLELFNVVDLASRAMLSEHPAWGGQEVAHDPQVVVVGLGEFGRAIAVHAAREWQPRFRESGERLRMVLVDKDAAQIAEALCIRYPRLGSICEVVPTPVDVATSELDSWIRSEGIREQENPSAIYVCLENEPTAVSVGLGLRERFGGTSTHIAVRVREESGLAQLLPVDDRLSTFAVYKHALTPQQVLGGSHETLARAIHTEYVRLQVARGDTAETNPALVPWDLLPPRLQEANRRQADDVGAKLEALGCTLAMLTDWDADRFTFTPGEVESLAEAEHARWTDDYARAGWRFADGEKDGRRKTHPSLVPWSALSEDEKEKDRDTIRSLPLFLSRAGFQIDRASA